jgi:hypothetical protein
MPDIRDLLHDAAPAPRAYDVDAVRGRVDQRRGRRVGTGLLLALVLVAGVGGAVALTGDDGGEQPVVADQPTTSVDDGGGKVAGVTAVAFVDETLWTGDETGHIGPDGFSRGVTTPGPVRQLEQGDVLWAAGDGWVVAVDPVAVKSLGTWDTDEAVADIQPLDGQHVAISLPDAGEVAIVRTAAEGLEEIERIPVTGSPSNLVLTTGDDLWVNDDDVIRRIDWGAGGAVDEQPWSGALLAPSMSGGIWAVDGDRVVDLAPQNLSVGVSVAEGDRYTVEATDVFETSFGLFVAGPAGLTRHEPGAAAAGTVEVVDPDVPSALSGSGDRVAYVVGGQVRTAQGGSAANGGTQTSAPTSATDAAASFLGTTLGWDTVDVGEGAPQDESIIVPATLTSTDRGAQVTMQLVAGEWVTRGFWTFGDGDIPATVSLGNGTDHVGFDYREDGLTPELTVRYGDDETVLLGDPGGAAAWDGDLGFVADTPGWVQILWRDADGVALEGWGTELPVGPFSAG